MSEPRTEAGRRLLADMSDDIAMEGLLDGIRVAILAIEAEARADLARRIEERLRERVGTLTFAGDGGYVTVGNTTTNSSFSGIYLDEIYAIVREEFAALDGGEG